MLFSNNSNFLTNDDNLVWKNKCVKCLNLLLYLCGWVGGWFDPAGPSTQRDWHRANPEQMELVFPPL